MATSQNRNTPLEALRFLFMLIVCVIHYDYDFSITSLHHGYLAVEFFFVVSVFFIYTTYQNHPQMGSLDFTYNKVKKIIIPVYICLFLQMMLDRKTYFYLPDNINPDTLLNKYFFHIHEFFFLQTIGLTTNDPIIAPLWFVSVLVVGGGLLFTLVRNYGQKAISLLIPLFILFGINYNSLDGNVFVRNNVMYISGINPQLVRGMVAMSIGIITSYIFEKRIKSIVNQWIFNLVGVISLAGYTLIFFAKGNHNYMLILFVPMILISCFKSSWLNICFGWRAFNYLGSLSMYMYFVHSFVVSLVWIINSRLSSYDYKIGIITYLLMVIFASWILKLTSTKITEIMNKKEIFKM